MPLVKTTLKGEIETLLTDMRTKEEIIDSDFADKLATAIDKYIKSATITVAGIQTTGNQAAQSQTAPVTATIN